MYKEEFPIFLHNPSLVYLDSAATTQKPRVVIEAMEHFFLRDYGTVHRAIYSLAARATARYDEVRERVRHFLGAKEKEEIVFTRGTTEGINLIAHCFSKSFSLAKGDEILITETEHHANIVPWQIVCEERGASLRVIPVDDKGEVSLETVRQMLSSGKVKLLSIAHIANATGVIHPIKEIIALAHAVQTKVLVDAAQSVAHFPLNVRDLDVDFLVFSGHKMYGPTGIGILYGKKTLLDRLPPYQGGGDMIRQVSFEKTTYQDTPLKFEAGTPSIAEVIGLGRAIEFLQEIGFEQIALHDRKLIDYAVEKLSLIPGVNFLVLPPREGSIISFYCDGCHPLDVGTLLDMKGIAVRTGHLCAQPTLSRFGQSSVIRMSVGLYSTKHDIDRLVEALREVLYTLRG